MRINVQAVGFVVVVLALWAGDARAASAAGSWKSTSGNSFTIPASKTDFDIVCKRPTGEKVLFQGKWNPGKVGVQFTYREGFVVCTFDPSNPDALMCQEFDPATQKWITRYWVRIH